MLMTHGVLCIYCGNPVEDWRRWTEVCQRCEDEMMEEGDEDHDSKTEKRPAKNIR